jgi:hypothetical protein
MRSWIWKYLTLIPASSISERTAKCKLCDEVFEHSVNNGNGSLSYNHLTHAHKLYKHEQQDASKKYHLDVDSQSEYSDLEVAGDPSNT